MSQQATLAGNRHHLLLARTTAVVGAAAVMNCPRCDCLGYKRVKGYFICDAAPAAGFPRYRVGGSALNALARFDETVVIPQDFSQPNFFFPFDILLEGRRWVDVNYTVGAAPGTTLTGFVVACPE